MSLDGILLVILHMDYKLFKFILSLKDRSKTARELNMNLTVLQEATSAFFNMNLSLKRFGFQVTECNHVVFLW